MIVIGKEIRSALSVTHAIEGLLSLVIVILLVGHLNIATDVEPFSGSTEVLRPSADHS